MHKSTRAILSQNGNTISYITRFNKLCRLKNSNNIKERRKAIINFAVFKIDPLKNRGSFAGKILPDILDILFLCGIIIHLIKYRMSNLKYSECLNLFCTSYFFSIEDGTR